MMRRATLFTASAWLCLGLAAAGTAQTGVQGAPVQPPAAAPSAKSPDSGPQPENIDGIAARIEDDIITESEVRELAAFQRIVDGMSKTRDELIKELAEQYIAQQEADTAKFPKPSAEDVDNAYAQLATQCGGAKQLNARAETEGLDETALRRMLEQQLYLSRFLDYRFRPAVQVDDEQVEAYYRDEFVPQVKERGQQVPAFDSVEETIREVLVQRAITQRANEWLDDARSRLQIETLHGEGAR